MMKKFIAILAMVMSLLYPGLAWADEDHDDDHEQSARPTSKANAGHDDGHEGHGHEHAPARSVILDISAGYGYGGNGFIVPKPLVGGLEDGHGGWLHLSLHPGRMEWLGFALGADVLNKDDGNWGWGLHLGVEFEAHLLSWLRLSGSPFLGYHGERRLISLSGEKLVKPETLSGFNFGLEAGVALRVVDPLWLVVKAECSLTAPGSHKYWEWECGPRAGLGVHF